MTRRPAQHNDSVSRESKQADQGPTKRKAAATGPENPHVGRGHDERGRYGQASADPDTESKP